MGFFVRVLTGLYPLFFLLTPNYLIGHDVCTAPVLGVNRVLSYY